MSILAQRVRESLQIARRQAGFDLDPEFAAREHEMRAGAVHPPGGSGEVVERPRERRRGRPRSALTLRHGQVLIALLPDDDKRRLRAERQRDPRRPRAESGRTIGWHDRWETGLVAHIVEAGDPDR